MKTIFALSIACVAGLVLHVSAQDACPDPPQLPASYYAFVSSNAFNQTSNQGKSFAVQYLTDGLHSVAIYYEDGITIKEIYDMERQQVIIVTGLDFSNAQTVCLTKDMTIAGEWMFTAWHDKMPVHGTDLFFRFLKSPNRKVIDRKCGKAIQNLVPVNVWNETLRWEEAKADITISYSWSDNSSWVEVSGQNKDKKPYTGPVTIKVQADGNFGKINEEAIVSIFLEDKQPTMDFYSIPDGVICHGLNKKNRNMPKLPNHFSFVTEVVTKNADSAIHENVVFYQTRYYDNEFNITRMDSRQVQFSDHIDTENETITGGIVTTIHDFNRDIAFIIDHRVGTCNMTTISDGDDAIAIDKNHILVANPKHLLGIDNLDFTWYAKKTERGISAEQFRAFEKDGIAHEFLVTSLTDDIQGDHIWDHQHPLKHSIYYLVDPSNIFRIEYNIFNFDKDRPSLTKYDVTDCYKGTDKRRFEFAFLGSIDELKLSSLEQFKNDIHLFLIQNTNVSPLRIAHIDMNSRENTTYVTFTLLQNSLNDLVINDAEKQEFSSEEAILFFQVRINDTDKLTRPFIDVPGEVSFATFPIPNSLREIGNPNPTDVPKPTGTDVPKPTGAPICTEKSTDDSTKYSPGSMAALGICMVLIGGIATFGILIYFKPRFVFRRDPGFQTQRFVNSDEPHLKN